MSVSPRLRIALFCLAVGIVLADSSVVTIALPEIMARYDVDVETLAWALTSFNLGLAVAALPAAYVARPRPRPIFATGAVVFASASIMCAVAPSFAVFVAARAVQGIAGAAVVCAALDFLIAATPTSARAVRLWALAGILGAALGPAAGGALTQLVGWEAIFAVQAPLMVVTLAALAGVRVAPALRPAGRPHLGANAALMLVSGALVAALFLLVILLINGWRLEPLVAAAVVTVMPIAALVAVRFGPAITHLWARAASGAILISGGLAALAWLPEAGAAWTIPPQLAVGAGLGLALSALTVRALAGRPSPAIHGGWTIAARHAGVVLGLLVLTPIFATDLEQARDEALAAGTSFVLDSRVPAREKIGVARDILVAVDKADEEARVPDVAEIVRDRGDDRAHADLAGALQEQLDRAATNAFSRSFLVAALIGLAALVPILFGRREAVPE